MSSPHFDVLLVEDSPADASVVRRLLGRARGTEFALTTAQRVAQAEGLLRGTTFDVVLLDLSLPDSTPGELDHLHRLHQLAPKSAFVVLTGMEDEELALEAMRSGAQDFLRKQELGGPLLERSLRYAIERNRAELALRLSEERYALAVTGANDGIWDWDLVEQRVYYSQRWQQMLGFEEEGIGTGIEEWLDRVHPEDRPRLDADLDLHFKGLSEHFQNEHRVRHRDGAWRWVLARGVAVRDSAGRSTRLAGSMSDVTLRRQAEEQLQHDALHDALTGLSNRVLLRDHLAQSLGRAQRRQQGLFALLFLDLDRFKNVNDSLGHLVGDELLMQIAKRLEGLVRPGDTVARLGGDEFAILAEDLSEERYADRLADRIVEELSRPVQAGGHEIFVSASIGIALGPRDYTSPDEVLRDADIAMYRAKLQRPGKYEVFDPDMHESAVAVLQLENDLKRALENGELVVYYQPIVELPTGRLCAFEALVRWRHPQRGLVYPEDFIPIAEETGLIVPLGQWVLLEACREMAHWRRDVAGAGDLAVSVNISERQLRQPDLVDVVLDVLEKAGLPPEGLRLEITESMLMADVEPTIRKLMELRALGVQIHIDDFGTGYSSLAYLHSLPTDTLKIDRTFVSGMGNGKPSQDIVSTIVTLARKLGMRVAAEGLETADQVAAVRSLACDQGQGFYFSQAVDPRQVEELLLQHPANWC